MGYAFLYGVFGSLIGSSLGGALYGAWLKPLVGTPGGPAAARTFWLLFVVLDLFAVAGLLLYDRIFATATPAAVVRARAVMRAVYLFFLAAGGAFLWRSLSGPEISWKTLMQALILALLGVSGLLVGRRRDG
jgi:cytochrome b subunit of formate dehydrogenase